MIMMVMMLMIVSYSCFQIDQSDCVLFVIDDQ